MATPRFILPQTYEALNDRINAYTDERSLFERSDVVGAVGHARGAVLEIGETLPGLLKAKAELVELEFYADHLSARTRIQQPPGCALMTFVARIAFAGSPLKIDLTEPLVIMLHCSNSSTPISFVFGIPQIGSITVALDPSKRTANHRCWAVQIHPDGEYGIQSLADTLSRHFDAPSLVDLIKDDGKLASIGHDAYNDNLRKLLDYQMLLASVIQDRDPAAAYDISVFVLRTCEGIPKALDYYARASALAASKVVGESNSVATIVPKLDLSIARQVLESRLQAAATFEDAFRELQGQDANSKNVRLFATIALEASADSEQAYSFIADLASQRFNAAHAALKKSQLQFQSLQLTLADRQKAFKEGIETWKTKSILKAVGEGLLAVAVIGGSIAIACVVPPAGAAGMAAGTAGVGKAVEGVASAAEKVGKIAKIIEIIKKIYNKLEPGLKKVDKLVSALTTIVDLSSKMSAVNEAVEKTLKSTSMPASRGDDAINLTADWDVFQAEMNTLYDSISDQNIDGSADFFLAITQMVIRGKAILTAQSAVTSTGDAYLTVLTQRITQKRHTERLRAAIPMIQGNPSTLRLIKLTMAERLLTLRTWIILDFQQYLAAYAWHALDPKRPITSDPMKEIGGFRADAATLQATAAQADSRVRAQSRTFRFSSKGSSNAASPSQPGALDLPTDFLDRLKRERVTAFAMDIRHLAFARFSRIRLTRFRVFLEGLSSDESGAISLRVVHGQEMRDLGVPGTIEERMQGSAIQNASRILNFVTTESVFGFEYVASTREILLDGALSGEHNTSPLSPFRTWTLYIDPDTNLEAVDGCSLDLTCDVTYV